MSPRNAGSTGAQCDAAFKWIVTITRKHTVLPRFKTFDEMEAWMRGAEGTRAREAVKSQDLEVLRNSLYFYNQQLGEVPWRYADRVPVPAPRKKAADPGAATP